MKGEEYLTKPGQFSLVLSQGKSWVGRLVVLKALPNELKLSRYGFVTSKRLGKAVVRNMVKRLFRNIMRQTPLKPGWDIVFIARPAAAGASFADWITAEYDTTQCSTTFLGGTPDYYSGLTSAQANLFDVTVRGLDDNANNCFPGSNENALISFTFSDCCWNNGLGNTPGGYATWQSYDLSMLRVNNLGGRDCSAGYPCNPAGRVHNSGSNCYDASCKSAYASVWVR